MKSQMLRRSIFTISASALIIFAANGCNPNRNNPNYSGSQSQPGATSSPGMSGNTGSLSGSGDSSNTGSSSSTGSSSGSR